jgi:predicted nucleotidyltransferase
LISGVFIKSKESRVDLLIVGDKMKKSKVEEEIRKLEAEIGTELIYALFDTKEFSYRLNMYDKLVRDILDFPHEVVFQAKELSTQALKKN